MVGEPIGSGDAMTTLAPPELSRPDAPTYSVWDVVAAHVELSGMVRPLPRPCFGG